MKKRWIVAAILAGAVIFGAGFLLGNRWTFSWMMNMQRAEVVANLNFTVEQACRVRTGDQSGAISLMEQRMDAGITSLAQAESWDDLPQDVQKTLRLLKLYRTAYPPATTNSHYEARMEMIRDPESVLSSCSRAQRDALTSMTAAQ